MEPRWGCGVLARSPDWGRLLDVVGEYMAAGWVPGASVVALGSSGALLVEAGLGYASVEEQRPAGPGTLYGLASITKAFTAVAVMQLVEQGLLSLDDPADKYLPIELRVGGKPVTVEHLLSHTSGVPALGYAEASFSLLAGQPGRALQRGEVLRLLERGARHWAVAEPGERFFYLNEGYVALGFIVERVSGVSYGEYVERNIAGPLGVKVFLDPGEAAATGELAQGYMVEGGRLVQVPATRIAWSDGGLYGSAWAAARLFAALMGGGEPLLSRSSVEEMTRPRALLPSQIWGDDSYGLGVSVYPGYPLGRLVGHSGALPGYRGFAGYVEGLAAAAVLGNGDLAARDAFMEGLSAAAGGPEMPWARWRRTLAAAEGLYEGFMGILVVCVERLGGGFLRVRSINPPGLIDAVLVPSEVGSGYAVLETSDGVKKTRVELLLDGGEPVELVFERYRLRRRGVCRGP